MSVICISRNVYSVFKFVDKYLLVEYGHEVTTFAEWKILVKFFNLPNVFSLFQAMARYVKKNLRGIWRSEDMNWYCFICKEDRVADMRLCTSCCSYVHEECVGLTASDKELYLCPNCED